MVEAAPAYPSAQASSSAQASTNVPNVMAAIGPPGMTPAATQRWYAVTIGSQVGVFQGWYVYPIVIYCHC